MSPAVEPRVLRFGAFEMDLANAELRRAGVLVKLSPQQFRLLRHLAENPGRVSTREEIQQKIWGAEVFVDFDRSLNVCVAQLRSVLRDDPEAPRFIQTVPRRGYRFVAPVERVEMGGPAVVPAKRTVWPLLALSVIAIASVVALFVWRALQPPERTMLAVLPFENVTHRAEDEPVLAGLLDELLTDLGSAAPGRMGVIGRRSVQYYAARNTALAPMARELGVEYVIEGEARWASGRLRISARLVRARNQQAVWAEAFEGGASGFELEEETSARIIAGVVRALYPEAPAPRVRRPDAEAYRAFLNGRYWQQKDARQAVEWFERATRADRGFAAAYSAMAEAATGVALSGGGSDAFETARRAAAEALGLDESSAEAHNAMARVLFWRDWNFAEAERHYRRALALNPSLAQTWHDYAFWQIVMGHAESGVAALRRAIALDPLSARVNVDAGWVLLQAHHFSEAMAQAERALELEPGNREAEFCLARARAFAAGRTDEAALELYRRRSEDANAYARALANAVLGRGPQAIAALEDALARRDAQLVLVGTEPAFASLHGDPRFQAVRAKVGLPESR